METEKFLPMTREEMDKLGWPQLDILLVTGDAYIDHHSFGVAIIGRVLLSHGYKVGIIAQPDWNDPKAFEVQPVSAPNWNIVSSWDENNSVFHLQIVPSKFGSGTVFLKDNNNSKNNRSFTLSIEHSAAYDTTSYPRPLYNDAMRYPEKYRGTDISIYGKVVQKMASGDSVALRVATSWGWDDVFYVTYRLSEIGISIIEGDWVTIYGESTGEYTYTAVMGNEITIPSMQAERIFMGNN